MIAMLRFITLLARKSKINFIVEQQSVASIVDSNNAKGFLLLTKRTQGRIIIPINITNVISRNDLLQQARLLAISTRSMVIGLTNSPCTKKKNF